MYSRYNPREGNLTEWNSPGEDVLTTSLRGSQCFTDMQEQYSTFGNVSQAQFAKPSALSQKVRMKTKISQVILVWTYNNEGRIIALINATTWGTTKWQNWKGLYSPNVIKEESLQTVAIWILFIRSFSCRSKKDMCVYSKKEWEK